MHSTVIKRGNGDGHIAQGTSRISKLVSDAKNLRRGLGNQFVRVERNENVLVHQSVATMLFAQSASLVVEFLTWSQAIEGLNTGEFQRRVLEKEGHVIIAPTTTINEVPGLSLQSFYDILLPVQTTNGRVSIFPSETERRCELGKVGDIRALDAIAGEQALLGNVNRAYRPRTCFGVGHCRLADQQDDARMVLKRSHSAASEHVKITSTRDRELLKCYRKDPQELKPATDPGKNLLYNWFHQEYVDSLQTLGEFRVFVTCDEAPGRARVVSIALTKPQGSVVAVHELSPHFFGECNGIERMDDLKAFALFIHQQLLNRPEAKEHFESLQVGVRLDIGISKDNRWFVNEVTRAFDADQFASLHLPYPQTAVAEALGLAFRKYCIRRAEAETSM